VLADCFIYSTHNNVGQVAMCHTKYARFSCSYVIDAGGGYTFWQVRIRSERPAFTKAPASNSVAPSPALDQPPPSSQPQPQDTPHASDQTPGQGSDSTRGHQSDLPYLVGGGLGVPGSKARVLDILDKAGYQDVMRVVQVMLGNA